MYELENISWSWMFLLIALIGLLFITDRLWKSKTQKLFFSKSNLYRLFKFIKMIFRKYKSKI